MLLMYRLGTLLILFGSFASFAHLTPIETNAKSPREASIVISPTYILSGQCIEITEAITGNESGNTIIKFPDRASGKLIGKSKGSVQQRKVKNENSLEFSHKPKETIEFSYKLCRDNKSRNIDRPIIEHLLVYLPIHASIAIPVSDNSNKWKISVELKGFPKQYALATSYGINNRKAQFYDKLDNFKSMVVSIGNFNINSVYIKDDPVYVVTTKKWSYFKQSPTFYLKNLIEEQRSYWDDFNFPHYVIMLIDDINHVHKKHFSGTHYRNFIAALLPNEASQLEEVLYPLSHELSHAWFLGKVRPKNKGDDLGWFFEGVNDYFGLRAALKSKSIKPEKLVKFYNLYLSEYTLSPIKYAPMEEFKKYTSFKGNYNLISQIKGHFLAKELHQRFPKQFEEAMKSIVHTDNSKDKHITFADIDDIFSHHFGQAEWGEMRNNLLSGKKLVFPSKLSQPTATLNMKTVYAPVFGFDISCLLKEKAIRNIDNNSNAYKAGLRNGQTVLEYFVDFKEPRRKSRFVILDNGKERTIEFSPNATKRKIPQYKRINSV